MQCINIRCTKALNTEQKQLTSQQLNNIQK